MSPLEEVISGAGVEVVDMGVSDFSELLVLSAVTELLEAAEVDATWVGESSLPGVELSPGGLLNHDFPKENKPVSWMRQRKTEEREKSGMQLL